MGCLKALRLIVIFGCPLKKVDSHILIFGCPLKKLIVFLAVTFPLGWVKKDNPNGAGHFLAEAIHTKKMSGV